MWSVWMLLVGDLALAGPHDFDVAFAGCTEFAGIGFIPYNNALARVPEGYTIAGDGTNAIIVVRVVQCDSVSVDGKKPRTATLSQVGVTLVGPDETADINNYTLWYVTDHPQLHAKLQGAGVDSVHDSHLSYLFTPDGLGGGTLDISVDPPQSPAFDVSGTALEPVSSPTEFIAHWWAEGVHGTVSMRTVLPEIQFSSASTALTTDASSEMADLIGGTSLTFAILDSYNAFATTAVMEVITD